MLKAEHLSFRYHSQQRWILQNFSLELTGGEVVGLTGPSGLGKTTIGKLLAGYLQPTQGKVTCNGQPLSSSSYCPVQLIFQNPELAVNPRWQISKILAEGQPPSDDLLAALGIHQSWLNRYPHELSGGELQRIAVARSLNSHTCYLIADEMTAMLDANTQALIWQVVIKYARERELGILVISHEAPLLKRLCERTIHLSKDNSFNLSYL
ncbi:MAG: ATP-binding cassette domain-containing protein [Pelatocladus maniniholoensis HA4357-MV3]|jgi:peptide/nickel transport system ATP-binding protein/Fe3+-transporting ATPase|uniref:ATP-binding cassette domain-containing protein n=1 Tax=Pelatocladus maniniholoensis HA4357-MV3 TaxID=1117104 RepID=A0A9E3H483_9NOST|nr:ATP-binding cassette domain-containing protein [Pelatocladus maniniholoensis HA4357-MV3]